jgi:hypothetical protein
MKVTKTRTLPAGDRALLVWTDNFRVVLARLLERLGFPPATYELITALRNTYATALDAAEAPATRTAGRVKAKNDAKKALEKELRQDIAEYLTHNRLLRDEDREDLGLPVPDHTHTPVPAPDSTPEFSLEGHGIGRVRIRFHDQGSESKARPYGVNGAVVLYDVLPTPPSVPSALTRNVLATRSPFTLVFAEGESEHKAYVALCWQNEKGEKGPWSAIQGVMIP